MIKYDGIVVGVSDGVARCELRCQSLIDDTMITISSHIQSTDGVFIVEDGDEVSMTKDFKSHSGDMTITGSGYLGLHVSLMFGNDGSFIMNDGHVIRRVN